MIQKGPREYVLSRALPSFRSHQLHLQYENSVLRLPPFLPLQCCADRRSANWATLLRISSVKGLVQALGTEEVTTVSNSQISGVVHTNDTLELSQLRRFGCLI